VHAEKAAVALLRRRLNGTGIGAANLARIMDPKNYAWRVRLPAPSANAIRGSIRSSKSAALKEEALSLLGDQSRL
jgi:hypothetical protein